MISREIENKVLAYANQYPVVTITGPRQSGKTTLAKMIFPDKPYVSLESIEERNFGNLRVFFNLTGDHTWMSLVMGLSLIHISEPTRPY